MTNRPHFAHEQGYPQCCFKIPLAGPRVPEISIKIPLATPLNDMSLHFSDSPSQLPSSSSIKKFQNIPWFSFKNVLVTPSNQAPCFQCLQVGSVNLAFQTSNSEIVDVKALRWQTDYLRCLRSRHRFREHFPSQMLSNHVWHPSSQCFSVFSHTHTQHQQWRKTSFWWYPTLGITSTRLGDLSFVLAVNM